MVRIVIKNTFILSTFGIICVNVLFYIPSQNLKSLTSIKSYVRSNMKRREYVNRSQNTTSTFPYQTRRRKIPTLNQQAFQTTGSSFHIPYHGTKSSR
jgi:hypothetical protein